MRRLLLPVILGIAVLAASRLYADNQAGALSFQIVMTKIATGERAFTLQFPTAVVSDVEPGPASHGKYQWVFWDRHGYSSAAWGLRHEDPGFHGPIDAVRVFLQIYSEDLTGGIWQINDRAGLEPNLAPAYPYDKGQVTPVDSRYPGAKFVLTHKRPWIVSPGGCKGCSIITWLELPAMDRTRNAKTAWYYQGGGIVVITFEGRPVARVIVSGELQPNEPHGMYTFDEARFTNLR